MVSDGFNLHPYSTDEQRRAVYPNLLKRMDDSRNEIRIAACSAVAAFFEAMPDSYDETNTGYLLKGRGVCVVYPGARLNVFM